MKFGFSLMGMELFAFEFAWPSRGVYPVPDFIPSELDYDFESEIDSMILDEDDDS